MADSLEQKLARFKIGDNVSIVGGMGDWDNGVVTGVYVTVTYRIMTEYGREWHVEAEKVVGPIKSAVWDEEMPN